MTRVEIAEALTRVRSGVVCPSVQNLSDGHDTGALQKVGVERLPDMLGSVDPESIDVVRGDEVVDPGTVSADDIGILGVEVDESDAGVSKPALLDLGLVVVVRDPAERVVFL